MPGRAQKNTRPSVATKPVGKSVSVKGPQEKNGRDRIRPGDYPKPTPAFDGPSRVLKNCDD